MNILRGSAVAAFAETTNVNTSACEVSPSRVRTFVNIGITTNANTVHVILSVLQETTIMPLPVGNGPDFAKWELVEAFAE